MTCIYFTRARLRTGHGTSSLAAFLAESSNSIGRGHHLVWSLFGDHGGNRPFLYCNLGANASDGYLLYSRVQPEDRHSLWDLECREFKLPDLLQPGDQVEWSVRVNPVIKSGNIKHDVGMRAWRDWCDANPLAQPCERPSVEEVASKVVPQWLVPRLSRAGLLVDASAMTVASHRRERFLKNPKAPKDRRNDIVFWATDVSGRGIVSDAGALRDAICAGIGGARSYGCGLLLLRRP